jgi:hypothetical protein
MSAAHTEAMEIDVIDDAISDPALTPFVTATEEEIAYAEELLRRIEQRYLNLPIKPGAHSDASAD